MLINIFHIQASKLMNKWLFIVNNIVFVYCENIYSRTQRRANIKDNRKFSFKNTFPFHCADYFIDC